MYMGYMQIIFYFSEETSVLVGFDAPTEPLNPGRSYTSFTRPHLGESFWSSPLHTLYNPHIQCPGLVCALNQCWSQEIHPSPVQGFSSCLTPSLTLLQAVPPSAGSKSKCSQMRKHSILLDQILSEITMHHVYSNLHRAYISKRLKTCSYKASPDMYFLTLTQSILSGMSGVDIVVAPTSWSRMLPILFLCHCSMVSYRDFCINLVFLRRR